MTPEDKINKLEAEVSRYKEKYENAVQSYDELLFQLRQMQRAQFGSTSEKYSDIFSGQQALFEAEELLDDSGDDDDDPDPDGGVPVKEHRRKKKSGVSTYDHLPTRRFEFVPLWQIAVYFMYAMRRVDCPTCGVKVEHVS